MARASWWRRNIASAALASSAAACRRSCSSMRRAFGMNSRMPPGFGWTLPEPEFDWATLIANKDKEIARLEAAYCLDARKSQGRDRARSARRSRTRIRSGLPTAARSRPEHILIATGGAPYHGPRIPGLEHVISSNEAFHLPELPQRIVIQGGGYVALEFAGIFSGLGLAGDGGLSRREHPARLRRRRARITCVLKWRSAASRSCAAIRSPASRRWTAATS